MPDELLRGADRRRAPARRRSTASRSASCPRTRSAAHELERLLADTVEAEGQRVVSWRDIPVEKDYVGITANWFAPYIKQLVVAASPELAGDQDAFERKLYVIRRVAELAAGPDLVIPSFSSRTIVYKGMLTAPQLLGYYPDLQDPRTKTALALVHSRFSTNTFPSWELAHPYRYIAHNGEINTLRGNVNWMRARESQLASELFGDDLEKVLPVVRPGGSDSATFDNVLELLVLAGRSLPHAVMMMVPEAWEERDDLPEHLRAFYAFHSCVMEPWDGPAAICFTDGRVIGATLDRNGLRPGRWMETQGRLGRARVGVRRARRAGRQRAAQGPAAARQAVPRRPRRGPHRRRRRGQGATSPRQRPYGEWYEQGVVRLEDLPERQARVPREPLRTRQLAFGYTQEDLRVLLAPMAAKGEEPIGSMGNDLALAVLSDQAPPLFSYFKQLFAQVTNPPIDPIRESVVMSIRTGVGSEANLLTEGPDHAHQLVIPHPILRNAELESLRGVDSSVFRSHTIPITWPVADGPEGMTWAVRRICEQAAEAIAYGANILVLSDRGVGPERAAIPSLLAVAAVHHHLVREGTRLQAGLVLESGEPREVHHFATLIGYGASAINPYLMLESLERGRRAGRARAGRAQRRQGDRQGPAQDALEDGHLDDPVLQRRADLRGGRARARARRAALHRHGVADRRHRPRRARARDARPPPARLPRGRASCCRSAASTPGAATASTTSGARTRSPSSSTRSATAAARATTSWAEEMNDASRAARPRCAGCSASGSREDGGIPLDEVEPASEIVKRFATGAMSLGSLSREAHETLAIAMNRLGGQVEHRRGRGGPGALHARPERRLAPLGDQAGRLGPLRRDDPLPHERRRDPDQDGAGRQARRGRPAARPQGRRLHRQDPLLDAGRRPDLAAAAPRHLLDRGPQAADLRPALREPGRAGLGQARGGGRRRHRRGGRGQGQRRPHPDLRPRRRHGRVAALVDPGGAASRGRSGWPRRSRRSCSTTCARGSGSRPTGR